MEKITTTEELKSVIEKMYHEHNAQVVHLSQMITVLVRKSGISPEEFSQEISSLEINKKYADEFNSIIEKNKANN